jgi:hypothetical protein
MSISLRRSESNLRKSLHVPVRDTSLDIRGTEVTFIKSRILRIGRLSDLAMCVSINPTQKPGKQGH